MGDPEASDPTPALVPHAADRRWDVEYDSDAVRPLFFHGYWAVLGSWARRDFHGQYRQSGLRTLWSLWQPIVQVAINGVFFYGVLNVTGDGLPYLVFIVASLMAYRYFSIGLGSSGVLSNSANVMNKVYFPREIIPLSSLVVGLIDLGVMLVILLLLTVLQGVGLSYTLIALPIPILLLLVLTAAVTVLLSTLAVFVRDINFLVPLVSQIVFYATPIMYPVQQVPKSWRWIEVVNPLAVIVEAVRDVVLRHVWPRWDLLGVHLVLAGVLLIGALVYLRALEHRMVDVA